MVDLMPIATTQRLDLAYTAAAKLCYIVEPLQTLTENSGDPDIETVHQLAIRAAELASAMLAALNDDMADLDKCAEQVYGRGIARRMSQEAANG